MEFNYDIIKTQSSPAQHNCHTLITFSKESTKNIGKNINALETAVHKQDKITMIYSIYA